MQALSRKRTDTAGTHDGIQCAYVLGAFCVQAWLDDPEGRPRASDVIDRIQGMVLPLNPDENAARPATQVDTSQTAEPTSKKARALPLSVSL